MNESTKKPRIGLGIGGWEISITIAGLTVVIGLLMESGSEIRHSWTLHRWPTRELWGAILVALGVLAEVVVGIFIARSSKREQLESNKAISAANERANEAIARAAESEQATAEANLERAKLEATVIRRSVRRNLNKDEESALITLLREYTGQKYVLRVTRTVMSPEPKIADRNTEQAEFTFQLRTILAESGWIYEQHVTNLPDITVSKGLTICFRLGETPTEKAVSALVAAFFGLEIDCQLITFPPEGLAVPMVICVGLL